MRRFRLMAVAVSSLLWLSACGSSGGEALETGADAGIVDESPATTAEVDDGPDLGALAASATWDLYREQVDTDTAIACALAREANPNFRRGMPEETFAKIDEAFFTARENPDDPEATAAFAEYEQLEPVGTVDNWIYQQFFAHEILALTVPEQTALEPLRAQYRSLSDEAGELGGDPEALIDIGPVLRDTLDAGLSTYQHDLGCPFVGGSTPLAGAMENFASDNESLGGRGDDARFRCVASAVIDLALSALVADPDDDKAADLASWGFALFDNERPDRQTDAAAQQVVTDFNFLVSRAGGDITSEQQSLVEAALEDWLDYRSSKPEGFILCPLDRGWEG